MKSAGVTIRAWERTDFDRLAAAAPRFSQRTLRLRFWGVVPTVPPSYLCSAAQRWPLAWDAVVALAGGELVGWAEYGRNPDAPDSADVAVCVTDAEQGHGVGTALLEAVIARARTHGLVRVHADIDPYNLPARRAWQAATHASAATLPLAG